MKISVIIPTLNESDHLPRLLSHLKQSGAEEVIVCDAMSEDGTAEVALEAGVEVVKSEKRSRAVQMNLAAQDATGEILYFVHADTRPPSSWKGDLLSAVGEGYSIGGYRFKFDSGSILLAFNSFFTRFNRIHFRGGDQSLFITRKVFDELGCFNAEMCIMEEYDLIERARDAGYAFHLMSKSTLVSARKYEQNTYMQVQRANLKAMRDYKKGVKPEIIRESYYRMLKHPKGD